MQILTSSIFEKGPRGRGRPVQSSPRPVSPNSSVSLSSISSDRHFSTDENGFLSMPVPGKGRGRLPPSSYN